MKRPVIVIISPHPDDLEIAMGGTVAKFVKSGSDVVSIVVTDGRGSTNRLGLAEEKLAAVRRDEVEKSCSILGIKELKCFNLADVKTDSNREMFSQMLEECLFNYNADQVYLPHFKIDKHRTHRTVSEISLNVLDNFNIPETWFYEVWTPFPVYDRIEDITEFVGIKREAVNAHKSQLQYKDYTAGILGLNLYRAVFNDIYENVNGGYAEVFIKYNR